MSSFDFAKCMFCESFVDGRCFVKTCRFFNHFQMDAEKVIAKAKELDISCFDVVLLIDRCNEYVRVNNDSK